MLIFKRCKKLNSAVNGGCWLDAVKKGGIT